MFAAATLTVEALEARSTGTCPANEFRIRIGQWMQTLPTGGAWKSLGSGFAAFLMQAAQKADADGSNLHHPPGNLWLARACRVSKDSIPGFYRAAEAAGLMTLVYGESGTRVRGYAVTLPLGGVPDWGAALDVLRADTRRVKQECRRRDDSARADLPGRGSGFHKSARAESGKSARAGVQVRTCGGNQDVSHHVEMAEVVATATTPRASDAIDASDSSERRPDDWQRMVHHLPPELREVAAAVPESNPLRRTVTAALQRGWPSPGALAARAALRRPPGAPQATAADRLAHGLAAALAADDRSGYLARLLLAGQVDGRLLLAEGPARPEPTFTRR